MDQKGRTAYRHSKKTFKVIFEQRLIGKGILENHRDQGNNLPQHLTPMEGKL